MPPFGIKAGPLPVLLCAVLLAHDAEVALYEEGSFVPQLTVAVFERLMRGTRAIHSTAMETYRHSSQGISGIGSDARASGC